MRIKFICLCQVSLFMDLKIAEEGSVSVASQAETDEHIASVRLWQQKREKRRCRNNQGVLILMTAIGQSQSESEDSILPEAGSDFRGRCILLVEDNELNSGMNSIDYNAISDQLTIIMVAFKEGWIHRDHWIF